MYKCILFDLDGTLTDSKEGIVNCVRYALEKMGRPIPDGETLLRFIGPPLLDSFVEFCGMSREDAARAVELLLGGLSDCLSPEKLHDCAQGIRARTR